LQIAFVLQVFIIFEDPELFLIVKHLLGIGQMAFIIVQMAPRPLLGIPAQGSSRLNQGGFTLAPKASPEIV
jgi:hypothetical protein